MPSIDAESASLNLEASSAARENMHDSSRIDMDLAWFDGNCFLAFGPIRVHQRKSAVRFGLPDRAVHQI